MNELQRALIEVQHLLDKFVKPLAEKGRDKAEINPITYNPVDYGKQDYDKVKLLVQVFMANLWDLGFTDDQDILNFNAKLKKDFEDSLLHDQDERERL